MSRKIAIIPGDGIGKEVIGEALRVLNALEIKFNAVMLNVGPEIWKRTGRSVPDNVIEAIKNTHACLFGATTTSLNVKDYTSAIVTLRKELNLFANIRPIKSYPNIPCARNDIDLIVFRENTEGLYIGEGERNENEAFNIRRITRRGTERVAEKAFVLARSRRKLVTIVHKANVVRESDGLWRDVCLEVSRRYPDVEVQEALVDAMALNMLRKPETFDVILTPNLYGDILSDLGAGLVGGLGMIPSGSYGENYALFEPVHGSAPDIAGKARANPIAAILSAKMMLEYLDEFESAKKIEHAVHVVLSEGRVLTRDLGGSATTKQITDEIISKFW